MKILLAGKFDVGQTINVIYSRGKWRQSTLPSGHVGMVISKISESIFELEVTKLASAQIVSTMVSEDSSTIVARIGLGATAHLKVRHE